MISANAYGFVGMQEMNHANQAASNGSNTEMGGNGGNFETFFGGFHLNFEVVPKNSWIFFFKKIIYKVGGLFMGTPIFMVQPHMEKFYGTKMAVGSTDHLWEKKMKRMVWKRFFYVWDLWENDEWNVTGQIFLERKALILWI